MPAKSSTERVASFRERRKLIGLERLELYAHPEDHAPLIRHAGRLARKREKAIAHAAAPQRKA